MSISWFTSLRRFFGYDDSPAQQRIRRRARRRIAHTEDGFVAPAIDTIGDFVGDPEMTRSEVCSGGDDIPSSTVDTTNSVVDTNSGCSFDMDSGGSFDGGGSCGGGSSGD